MNAYPIVLSYFGYGNIAKVFHETYFQISILRLKKYGTNSFVIIRVMNEKISGVIKCYKNTECVYRLLPWCPHPQFAKDWHSICIGVIPYFLAD